MNGSLLSGSEWFALAQALLHTLWGGAGAAGGLLVLLRTVPAQHARLRYGLSLCALLAVLFFGLGAWAVLAAPAVHPGALPLRKPASPASAAAATPTAPLGAVTLPETPAPAGARRSVPWPQRIVAFWLPGVAVCLLRTLHETFAAERLRRRCAAVTEPWLRTLLEEPCTRLRLSRRVRMVLSHDIAVPAVMGLFRPVILLPAALLTGLPPEACAPSLLTNSRMCAAGITSPTWDRCLSRLSCSLTPLSGGSAGRFGWSVRPAAIGSRPGNATLPRVTSVRW